MRLVVLADTHGFHRQISIPPGDVLVHAGDLTRHGDLHELRDFNTWLGELPHPHKLVIAGNHDRICEEVPELLPELLNHATYLCDRAVVIEGRSFYGAPWTQSVGGWAFTRSLTALGYTWAQIPHDTAVLLTHGPPLGACDQNRRGEHLGCAALAEAVLRVRPQLHVFGHIHEGYGHVAAHGTRFVNASICTLAYAPTNAPVIIEL